MYSLVSSWQQSDQSKSDYCQEQQINIHTFSYWVQKYKKTNGEKKEKPKTEKFISLQVESGVEHRTAGVELCYPNGVRLRLESQPAVSYLESLIRISL